MRRSPALIILLALGSGACAALTGRQPKLTCLTASADTSGWTRVADSSGFSFLLPRGFRENKVEPLDTHVRGFESEGITFSLDYGRFADDHGQPDASEPHIECPTRIGDRDAVIVLGWPDRKAFTVGAAWRDVGGGMHLWMGGAADTPARERDLLTIVRSVRFEAR